MTTREAPHSASGGIGLGFCIFQGCYVPRVPRLKDMYSAHAAYIHSGGSFSLNFAQSSSAVDSCNYSVSTHFSLAHPVQSRHVTKMRLDSGPFDFDCPTLQRFLAKARVKWSLCSPKSCLIARMLCAQDAVLFQCNSCRSGST